jgi:hypothetical protein
VGSIPSTFDRLRDQLTVAGAKSLLSAKAGDDWRRSRAGRQGARRRNSWRVEHKLRLVGSFSFQQATHVNHNLAQSIVVPTMTVSPGSATGAVPTVAAGGSALTPLVNPAIQA